MKRLVRIAAGVGLVIAGLVGLALPILPGWIWLIPGLAILAPEFPWAKRLLDWLKARLPQKTAQD